MYSHVSTLHELHVMCHTWSCHRRHSTWYDTKTQQRNTHVRGRSMWISRLESETTVGRLNGEAVRRAHTRIEFTNRTEITETKITVKTT